MRIWMKTTEFSEGKFLVVRRDGTTPDWPHFVMGARDPAVPNGLMAYAGEMRQQRVFDKEYVESVEQLAHDFQAYRDTHGAGDPEAPPHRKDLPLAIAMMRHEFSVADIAAALEKIAELGLTGQGERAAAIANELLLGRKPKAISA